MYYILLFLNQLQVCDLYDLFPWVRCSIESKFLLGRFFFFEWKLFFHPYPQHDSKTEDSVVEEDQNQNEDQLTESSSSSSSSSYMDNRVLPGSKV